jgi:hypothetical protein
VESSPPREFAARATRPAAFIFLRGDRARINAVAFSKHRSNPVALQSTGITGTSSRYGGASKQNVKLAASCDRASPHHDRKRGPNPGHPLSES